MTDNSGYNVDFINEISIKNFKSIKDITLELGRINVIIGANGTGKTNFLEAIAMGAAYPAILDGLDLKDDQQRLFVVRRGRNGNTLIERVNHKPKSNKKLSELWMSGIIGGLPDNF
jgi:predicted ATP-dependent endonuclease of OLD family